jgi:hypothetical protein
MIPPGTPPGTGINRPCEKLALLVGSNPLPNYLAAQLLKPKTVVLLYTPETRKPKDCLAEALGEQQIQVIDRCINDATDVRGIREACRDLDCDHLHYSGGTKPMAAQARMAFKGSDMQVSYLDERRGWLRFDDGWDGNLAEADVSLTIDTILKLHAIKRKPAGRQPSGGPTVQDLGVMSARVLRDPSIAQKLYDYFRPNGKPRNISSAKQEPCILMDYELALSASVIPENSWNSNTYGTWEKFLTGGWLEQWTAGKIRSSFGDAAPPIEISLKCERQGDGAKTEFEIDVALVRGHRLYVVSATTAQRKDLCKSKLFEVAMRSRQMGGDLARAALVCLLNGEDSKGSYDEQLRADIVSLWDAPNVPHVFALADLQEWAGVYGQPNCTTLRKWLDS